MVTIIYILANLAYFAALTPDEMLDSDAVAVSFAAKVMGPIAPLVPLFVACSCVSVLILKMVLTLLNGLQVGSLNGIIFTTSRMFFAGAR